MTSPDIALVCDFVNTRLLDSGLDALASAQGLSAWLHGHSLLSPDLDAGLEDTVAVAEFREAIRDLVGCNTGGVVSPASVEILGRSARVAPLLVTFSQDGTAVFAPPRADVAGAMAEILLAVAMGMVSGSWSRVKLCRDPQCRRAFYDRSKNGSGVWCRMARCGNRAKVRAYRLRKRAAGPPNSIQQQIE